MKSLLILIALFLILPAAPITQPLAAQQKSVKAAKKAELIVYYFHTSRRCKTCLSIERVARAVVKDKYGKDKSIVFRALDIEEEENEALAEKYEVSGSSLLVCRGDKSEDLTAEAFQYGLNDPGKLQQLLIATIDRMRKG
ncbi:MAG: nitrophenyl compound nitroreductase subunit ArsF family protein [Bacteroidota bacterium]